MERDSPDALYYNSEEQEQIDTLSDLPKEETDKSHVGMHGFRANEETSAFSDLSINALQDFTSKHVAANQSPVGVVMPNAKERKQKRKTTKRKPKVLTETYISESANLLASSSNSTISDMAAEQEKCRLQEICLKLKDTEQVLECLLLEIFHELQPSVNDHELRMNIVYRLTNLLYAIDICKGAIIVPFGSFASNLYTPRSDLDLSLVLPDDTLKVSKTRRLKVLRSVAQALWNKGGARKVQLLFRPRVPLLMFDDAACSVSCDLSINNDAAVTKSHILGLIVNIDKRCRQLIFLIKHWAKVNCINDPKTGTLNSYAISLLVIFHLQTRAPPVLPPLCLIIGGSMVEGGEIKEELICESRNRIEQFVAAGFGANNTSSLAELFISFFQQFSAIQDLWVQGLAVCPFSGRWGDRSTTDRAWKAKQYMMVVEDPFDRSENCARSVHERSFTDITKAFATTAEILANLSEQSQAPLREKIFPLPTILSSQGSTQKSHATKAQHHSESVHAAAGVIVPPISSSQGSSQKSHAPRTQHHGEPVHAPSGVIFPGSASNHLIQQRIQQNQSHYQNDTRRHPNWRSKHTRIEDTAGLGSQRHEAINHFDQRYHDISYQAHNTIPVMGNPFFNARFSQFHNAMTPQTGNYIGHDIIHRQINYNGNRPQPYRQTLGHAGPSNFYYQQNDNNYNPGQDHRRWEPRKPPGSGTGDSFLG